METTFLSDVVLVKAVTFNLYLFLFGIVFWIVFAFSGIWIWKRTQIGKMGFLFTLVTFLPFSYLCYQSYGEKDEFVYQLKIDKPSGQISFGDSNEPDISFPIAEFISYQIKSESESKKDGTRYTDTIYLHHNSSLLLPVAKVSVKRYKDSKDEFSRYATLSREMKKWFRVLPLPVETETGKPFKGLLVKHEFSDHTNKGTVTKPDRYNTISNLKKESLPTNVTTALTFPIAWKHKILSANWYFLVSLLAIGHLGAFIFVFNFREGHQKNMYWGILILFLGYLSFGSQYYFWILPKSNTHYSIASFENGYRFHSIRNGIQNLEGEWIPNSEKIIYLELPNKTLHFQTKLAYEKSMALLDSLENPSEGFGDALQHAKQAYDASDWVRWDLSDLPMEVAVRFFLVLR
ncbi:Hypothetical protein LBF_4067 [Leptospira biflexa serovar Patoc strain 'Patoc 1 (Ames)']|uniref:Uncharacterized protein n=1 Tax=Leptospira biflexa serovar Patoc (strain Patoc 1 / ATCC 23582 / Paris) TaxID=456481 RepID=B0STS2_LEPBP|nr:hypothetical protein [Leptospira biflexa]ABZ95892.1 Hypothetical protein LBF_4067 [Leptospira biflexa serovar Patoc strain 'Patoc 1 (Ames)']ABZ99606.1 Hypothetical protein; putative membrane protein [Leptospira biflexa serovar Patoc strain 'Patoc 1 (Paris)']